MGDNWREKKAEKSDIRRLHTVANKKGYKKINPHTNREFLYDLLWNEFQLRSTRDLLKGQLNDLISKMGANRQARRSRPGYSKQPGVFRLPSPDQKKKAYTQCRFLGYTSENSADEYLEKICKKTFNKELSKMSYYNFQNLITVLKNILARELEKTE